MSLLGRALARLAHRIGGQLMLELPDDLQPSFIAGLLKGANQEVGAKPDFALYVHGQRRDVTAIAPRVDFRELAMYRQGTHLAVSFASDNRGMSTYTSVYPLLLSNGFPSEDTASGGTGVARLRDFTACLTEVLVAHHGTHGLPLDEFREAANSILSFLAKAYEAGGNGQASFATDWWLHVNEWTETLARVTDMDFEPSGIERLYGCAGLPTPAKGHSLALEPKDYVRILQERWSSPPEIFSEIKRLDGVQSAATAAEALASLDWEESFSRTSLRSDSIVALVAMASGFDPLDKVKGWGRLSELDFEESYVDAKGKLAIRQFGSELPLPWNNALPILVAGPGESESGPQGCMSIENIELIIPHRPGNHGGAAEEGLHSGVLVEGARGCKAWLDAKSEQVLPDGLHLKGTLAFTPSKKASSTGWIVVSTMGNAARFFVDRCSGSFTLLRADEVALWAKPQGRSTKSALRGPIVSSPRVSDIPTLELAGPGIYDLAIAWGDNSGFDARTATIRGTPFNLPWTGMESGGAKASVDIADGVEVYSGGAPVFRVDIFSDSERPLAPIVAAANGLRPDTSSLVEGGTLGYLEGQLSECLANLTEGDALGCILVTNSRHKSDLVPWGNGIRCTPDLASRTGNDLSPGLPSRELLSHPAYASLRHSYEALKLPKILADIESEGDGVGLTISRISLDSIQDQKMNRLLGAYRELLEASGSFSSSDRFWARNPFSVVVYEEGTGYQAAQAVLLSPLHPIRLAWAWGLQVGLRQAYDDGAKPAESLALLDGTYFPASVVFSDQFDSPSVLMPVPIDARPGDLYIAWHASVAIVNKQASIPQWIAGRQFPVDGLSALSAASVSAALDDFLRVSPHVQSLHIHLSTTNRTRRSSSIDDGIMAKLGDLASSSRGLDGVAGIRITDSENRIGPIPSFFDINDLLAIARPGFNFEWVSIPPDKSSTSHVTFLEGNAALLAAEPAKTPGSGWIASLPLRRVPVRSRAASFTTIDYTLADPGTSSSEFVKTLHAYESIAAPPYALKMIPNPIGVAGRPGWLVAGDFGVDPRGISRAARDQANSDYILWDWRPATTIKLNREASRAQPYFVLASVPPALNSAIHARLKQLNAKVTATEVERRAKLLVSTLAECAIGLNTLLAIGHHQATGALGFYFALRSISTWQESAPAGEVRLVIPVDAVDPFLRASDVAHGDGSRKRADLLAVRAFVTEGRLPRAVLVPIEIKHYGLSSGEYEKTFPLAGESRLNEHADQLRSYQEQLQLLCETYRDAVGSHASLLGQRLAAVMDAALQLGPGYGDGAAELLAAMASGNAGVDLGKGVLLWYQAGASGMDGSKASWDEVGGSSTHLRNDVRVDPVAFEECFWEDQDGLAHEVLRAALDDASRPESTEPPVKSISVHSEVQPDHSAPGAGSLVALAASRAHTAPKIPPNAAPPVSLEGESAPSVLSVKQTATSPGAKPPREKMPAIELEKRYGTILAALSEFNVKVERPRGDVPYQEGPAFIEYAVSPSYGVSVNKIESQLQNLKLRLKLPSDAEIGCSTHKGNVILTVPKTDDERYFVDAEELWARWSRPLVGFKMPIGEDASGNIVELDLSNSNSPHLLIAGVTGSGKSEALLTILHGAARYYSPEELRLRLIDPKQTELNTLAALAHTEGAIGWSAEEAIELLEQAVAEMEHRYKEFRQAGPKIRNIAEYQATIGPMARWIIVLDEYADLVSDDTERKLIEKCLQRLSQKARAAGIHVIVSTQKPVIQVVNTVVKGNLPGKIALRVNTAIESKVILDETGAERLVGKGDAIIKAGHGKTRIQFARYSI